MQSIPELVSTALAGFSNLEHSVEAHEPSRTETIRLHLSRFKLWADGAGAYRPFGHRSLEYRLSGALMLRNHVIALLEDICRHLKEADIAVRKDGQELRDRPQRDDGLLSDYFDDDESELDEYQRILLQITNVIECLMRLAVTIRNPSSHEQFMSGSPELVSFFDFKHLEHVQHMFPRLEYNSTRRLAKALTYRRLFLRYRKNNHGRLEKAIEDDKEGDPADSKDGITAEASQLSGDTNQHSNSGPSEWRDDSSEVTATSYAPSCVEDSELHVPQIPRQSSEGRFLCPCCYLHITVENRHQWKQHVFGDLRPYICLDDSCHLIDNGFSRRKDWLHHMVREHWQIWICPFGCADCLTTLPLFSKHVSQDHDALRRIPDIKLHTRINMKLEEGECPLCREHKILSSQHYQSHVGNHLEQLVLFLLPGAGGAGETEDEEDEIDFELESHQSDDDSQLSEQGQRRFDQETEHSDRRFETAVRTEVEKRLQENDRLRAEKAMEEQHIQDMIDLGVRQRFESEGRRKAEEQRHDEQVAQMAVERERARVKAKEKEKQLAQKREDEVGGRAVEKAMVEGRLIQDWVRQRKGDMARKDDEEERQKERELQHEEEMARSTVETAQAEEREKQEQASRSEADFERKLREHLDREAEARRRDDDFRQQARIEFEVDQRRREDERKKDEEERQRERARQHEEQVARRAVEKAQAEERERQEQPTQSGADFERKFKEHLEREAEARRRADDLRQREAEARRLEDEARQRDYDARSREHARRRHDYE